MPNLQDLNLSNNRIASIPPHIGSLKRLETLNVNGNQLKDVFQVVDSLCKCPSLRSLFINLSKEEQVDYVLQKLPLLEFLNGLAVDRNELLEEEKQ